MCHFEYTYIHEARGGNVSQVFPPTLPVCCRQDPLQLTTETPTGFKTLCSQLPPLS